MMLLAATLPCPLPVLSHDTIEPIGALRRERRSNKNSSIRLVGDSENGQRRAAGSRGRWGESRWVDRPAGSGWD